MAFQLHMHVHDGVRWDILTGIKHKQGLGYLFISTQQNWLLLCMIDAKHAKSDQ